MLDNSWSLTLMKSDIDHINTLNWHIEPIPISLMSVRPQNLNITSPKITVLL
jgi:hypothetical protein